jgi:hypothetical protein
MRRTALRPLPAGRMSRLYLPALFALMMANSVS